MKNQLQLQIHAALFAAELLKNNLPSDVFGVGQYEVSEQLLKTATTDEEVIKALTSLMLTTAIMLQSNN